MDQIIKSVNNRATMVYIVMDPLGKNLLPAKEFGTLRILLSGKETNYQAHWKLTGGLNSMTSGDYLLLIGNPVFIAMAAIIAHKICGDQVKFLRWDRDNYKYEVERINDGSELINESASK